MWANANAASQSTSISSIQSNISAYQATIAAYQTWANANAASQSISITSLQANLGAYQAYANANASVQATTISDLQNSTQAFYAYANTKIGSNSNSNLIISSTANATSASTGALVVAGGVGVTGNVYASKMYTDQGVYWSGNNAPFSKGTSVTISDVPPVSPENGQFWFDSVNGVMYVYYIDANSACWVDFSSYTNTINKNFDLDSADDHNIPIPTTIKSAPSINDAPFSYR